MWVDNLGYELQPDDYVVCLTGDYAYTVQSVSKLTERDEGTFIRYMVTLKCKATVSAYNVISLRALNVMPSNIVAEKSGQRGYDLFGNAVNVGDKVLFLHSKEMYSEVGTVTKLAPKMYVFDIQPNRFGQCSYKKPYAEIISLSALSLDETIIKTKTRR